MGNQALELQEFKVKIKHELNKLNQYQTIKKNNLSIITNKVIDDYIYHTLISNWTKKNNLFIHPSTLKQKVLSIVKNYPDKSYFLAELKSQNMSEIEWTNKVKFSLLEKKALDVIKSNLPEPTKEELTQFYNNNKNKFKIKERVKIRQIITADEATANKALVALRNRFSFSNTYKKYSINYSEFKTPQISWVERESPSLFKDLFKLKKGQYSNIFKSDFGYHIAELLDRKREQLLSFNEAKKDISHLYSKQFQKQRLVDWLKSELGDKKVFINQQLISTIRFEQKVTND